MSGTSSQDVLLVDVLGGGTGGRRGGRGLLGVQLRRERGDLGPCAGVVVLEIATRGWPAESPALLRVLPTKDAAVLRDGQDLVSRAVARVERAELVRAPFTGEKPAAVASFTQEPLRPAVRVLNVAVIDAQRRALGVGAALAPHQDYGLRIEIAPTASDSVVLDAPEFSTELLSADTAEGHWFDVVVTSSDLDVPAEASRLFLPLTGPSWVCGCPGPAHRCAPVTRQPSLILPLRTRDPHDDATLRCTVYHRGNAVQSLNLHCVVTEDGTGQGRIVAVVDYRLSADAGSACDLPARGLNVLAAYDGRDALDPQDAPGTHRITLKGTDRVIHVDLTEDQVSRVRTDIGKKLLEITLGPTGTSNQYDADNGMDFDIFLRDLKDLARFGAQLAQAVVPNSDDRDYLREHLARKTTIQVSRVKQAIFPWALVYDIPTETDFAWELCPLLRDWEMARDALTAYPDACPYSDAHRLNVLCPYGFWGFHHVIEQPADVRGGVLRTRIPAPGDCRAATARSLTLDAALTDDHFGRLGKCLQRFSPVDCRSKEALRAALADPHLPFLYAYCHGRKGELAGTPTTVPLLEIGTDRVGAGDFAAWRQADGWDATHWRDVAPLVFLNGCGTAALGPADVVSFVDALAGLHVAGVIGTEITVTQEVAGEVALGFWRRFAAVPGLGAGAAMHETRIDLLRKNNVSGLVYTPYCSAELQLVCDGQAVTVGAA